MAAFRPARELFRFWNKKVTLRKQRRIEPADLLEPRVVLAVSGYLVDDLTPEQVALLQSFNITSTASTEPTYPMDDPGGGGFTPLDAESSPLIRWNQFRSDPRFSNIDGTGMTVAVLDTGIDLNHPAFGPDANNDGISDRIVYQHDFANNDNSAQDFDGHGSNVTSIAAGNDSTTGYKGMAPGADIVHLKVFTDAGGGQFSYTEAALQWVVANAAARNIVSVNMSLGDSGNYNTDQRRYGLDDELSALAAMGVTVVSAAGNSFYQFQQEGVAYPAADPNSWAVGAVFDANLGGLAWGSGSIDYTTAADRITSFSQRSSSQVDIFAPGALINGANYDGTYLLEGGTSQASPHIAGIVALAQQLATSLMGRKLTPTELRTLMRQSATTIHDGDDEDDNVANTNKDYPRVDVFSLGQAITDFANPAPTIPANQSFTIDENSPVNTVVGTFVATDTAGQILNYQLLTTGSAFDIDPLNGKVTVANPSLLNFELTPTIILAIKVTDNGTPVGSSIGTLTINLRDINEPPTSILLSPAVINENQASNTRVGDLSAIDPDTGNTLTFTLVSGQGSQDNSNFEIIGKELRAKISLDFEGKPAHSIRVKVTDQGGLSYEQVVTIAVGDLNEPPSAVTLPTYFAAENIPNQLIGTLIAVDPDLIDTRVFSLVAGTGGDDNALFSITGNQLFATPIFDYETKTQYKVRVKVRDSGGLEAQSALVIQVEDTNELPTVPVLSNDSVVEAAASQVIGTLSSTDVDAGDSVSFSLDNTFGSSSLFRIVGNVLSVGPTPLDYETATSHQIRVITSDTRGGSRQTTFTINVLDIDEGLTLSSFNIDENLPSNSLVGTFSALVGGTKTYTLVNGVGATDNASFNIVANQLFSSSVFNYEAKSIYSVRVQVTSSLGPVLTGVFTIQVNDLPEDPTDITLSNSVVAENKPVNTFIGTLTGVDSDAGSTLTYTLVSGVGSTHNSQFQIIGNALLTKEVLDYEAGTTRSIRVQVKDQTNRTYEKVFVLTVNNTGDPPTGINLSNSTVVELQGGATVGTLSAVDPDSGDTATFSLRPFNDSYLFAISGTTLKVGTLGLDYKAAATRSVVVRVTDSLGLYYEKTFTINVTAVNKAPKQLGLDPANVAENAPLDSLVGRFKTGDPDDNDTFSYTLVAGAGADNNGLFRIDGDRLLTAATFNFESKSEYSIRVQTKDAGGLTFEQVIAVSIKDVNEAPNLLKLSSRSVKENQPSGTLVGLLSSSDPDSNETATYQLVPGLGGQDNGLFKIERNELRTTAVLDREESPFRLVRVQVTDHGGLTWVETFSIEVTDEPAKRRFARAYNKQADYHFFTVDPNEFRAATQAGYRDEATNRTGFAVPTDPDAATVPIYRLYNLETGRHYYTANFAEVDSLTHKVPENSPNFGKVGWRYEKEEGYIYPSFVPGTQEIYRLYNKATGVHLYTESADQRDMILRNFPDSWELHSSFGFAFPDAPSSNPFQASLLPPEVSGSSAVPVPQPLTLPAAPVAPTLSSSGISSPTPVSPQVDRLIAVNGSSPAVAASGADVRSSEDSSPGSASGTAAIPTASAVPATEPVWTDSVFTSDLAEILV